MTKATVNFEPDVHTFLEKLKEVSYRTRTEVYLRHARSLLNEMHNKSCVIWHKLAEVNGGVLNRKKISVAERATGEIVEAKVSILEIFTELEEMMNASFDHKDKIELKLMGPGWWQVTLDGEPIFKVTWNDDESLVNRIEKSTVREVFKYPTLDEAIDAAMKMATNVLVSRHKKPVEPEIPRRIRMDQWTPTEHTIWQAKQAVEALDADVRLTAAVNLLSTAQELVADYVDGVNPEAKYNAVFGVSG